MALQKAHICARNVQETLLRNTPSKCTTCCMSPGGFFVAFIEEFSASADWEGEPPRSHPRHATGLGSLARAFEKL